MIWRKFYLADTIVFIEVTPTKPISDEETDYLESITQSMQGVAESLYRDWQAPGVEEEDRFEVAAVTGYDSGWRARQAEIDRLTAENLHLREALGFYADDLSKQARAALEAQP